MAFLGKNKAEDIINSYAYESWYMSGHSLGGAMAADYAAEHLEMLDGLVLLAAYPTKELKADDFSALCLYGSEDGVLNMEKVEKGREYMPSAYVEVCINGGNHAQFGNYGNQKGDKTAAISRIEQQEQTIKEICKMIQDHKGSEREKSLADFQKDNEKSARPLFTLVSIPEGSGNSRT